MIIMIKKEELLKVYAEYLLENCSKGNWRTESLRSDLVLFIKKGYIYGLIREYTTSKETIKILNENFMESIIIYESFIGKKLILEKCENYIRNKNLKFLLEH